MSALTEMLRKRLMTTWLWQVLFVLAVIGGFVSHHFTVQEMMGRIRFAAMDSLDTFYLANLGTFETAQHIHAELAKMAADTIFSRNPDGFDNPERLERLFNPATTTELNKDAARDAEVFRQQQIHQKIETGQIREIEVDDNTALVSVEGQVLRTGMFNNRIVSDAKRVTVFLRLTVNGDMARNGRYPLVVTNYQERFE
jgi:sulfur carrier protein ThiS